MDYPEYLILPCSTMQDRNVRIAVIFRDEEGSRNQASIPSRDVDLQHFLGMVRPEPFLMMFDEHPYWVTGINIDLSQRKIRMTAKRAVSLP